MATTTAFIVTQHSSHLEAGQATIDTGESLTLAIPCHGRAVVRIGIPTQTSAALTFQVQPYPGAAFYELDSITASAVTVSASTGGICVGVPALAGCYAFKIRSGTAGAPVTQTPAVVYEVQMVGSEPTSLT